MKKRLSIAAILLLLFGGYAVSRQGEVARESSAVKQTTAAPVVSGTPAPPTTGCNLDHVYHPQRLQQHGCVTVTGTVEGVRQEKDGDYHAILKVDSQYQYLLNSGNSKQHNDLVIEDVCQYTVTQSDAISACQGYHSPFPIPKVGKRYSISGSWVTDTIHSWNECHKLTDIHEIS